MIYGALSAERRVCLVCGMDRLECDLLLALLLPQVLEERRQERNGFWIASWNS
jgi:hypothetical protein